MVDINETLVKSDKYSSLIKTTELVISKDSYQIKHFTCEFQKHSATFW